MFKQPLFYPLDTPNNYEMRESNQQWSFQSVFKHSSDWDTGGNGCRYRWAPRMRGVFLAAAKRRLSGPCSGMSPPSLKIVKYTGIFHIVLDDLG